jgi:RNA polymerase sigma factor (sigma-70 family)
MPRRFFFRLLSAAAPAGDHVPDAELLRRFVAGRDSAAFELLVRRHADAVWAAAFRILRDEADADDAFQATFLVLARRGGSIRKGCVGGWLHQVAVNAALKLRAGRPPRATPDMRPEADLDAVAGPDRDGDRAEVEELAVVVHQELALLPERYRLPVVLCDLEGHTHAEAAKVLGWPVGTVSGRLSRARGLLRDRLTRRGLAPAAVLSACMAPAGTAHAAAAACGSTASSPAVSLLAEGVLSAMRTARLKLTAVAAGLLGLAGTGTILALGQVPAPRTPGEATAPEPGKPAPAPAAKVDPKFDPNFTAFPDLKPVQAGQDFAESCPRVFGKTPVAVLTTDGTYQRLLKARIEQGRVEVQKATEILKIGRWTASDFWAFHQCLEDMRAAAVELWASEPKSLVPWLEEFVILSKDMERFAEARVNAGTDPPHAMNTARRYRLRVEAELWKAKNPPAGRR